jgi:hypothetical protein
MSSGECPLSLISLTHLTTKKPKRGDNGIVRQKSSPHLVGPNPVIPARFPSLARLLDTQKESGNIIARQSRLH